ncbi:MAG: acylphosphatase [Nanohaloarchaea archaeon SW_7_46_7]|nr:MAG: acylphosphatase [Nanohaloarchaea archaeon SW_7_46_7]
MKQVHLVISGNVQGVGFRASMRRRARNNDVTGWVKNLENGKVEAVLEGEEDNVAKIMEWARKGPNVANVENIELEEKQPEYIETFEIKRN